MAMPEAMLFLIQTLGELQFWSYFAESVLAQVLWENFAELRQFPMTPSVLERKQQSQCDRQRNIVSGLKLEERHPNFVMLKLRGVTDASMLASSSSFEVLDSLPDSTSSGTHGRLVGPCLELRRLRDQPPRELAGMESRAR